MKEAYIDKRFNASSRGLIDHANIIITEAGEHVLTLRQLFYQMVIRGWLANSTKEYKRLTSILADARMAGLIDWDGIEDRAKTIRAVPFFHSPADFFANEARTYTANLWATQPVYCEVWIEKESLLNVIERSCRTWRVACVACRGYGTAPSLREAALRFADKLKEGKQVTVFHLGDHDPIGLAIDRDNEERLNVFARSREIKVVRLGLNHDQIMGLALPSDPTKLSGEGWPDYTQKFGNLSWELDALSTEQLDGLLVSRISHILDPHRFQVAIEQETAARDQLVFQTRAFYELHRG